MACSDGVRGSDIVVMTSRKCQSAWTINEVPHGGQGSASFAAARNPRKKERCRLFTYRDPTSNVLFGGFRGFRGAVVNASDE